MKSYTGGRNLAGVWTKNSATANLTYIDETANDDYRRICALKDWPFLERLRTITTTASTQFTTMPYDCDQVRSIAVIPNGSNKRYVPDVVQDRATWDTLNLTSFTSDIPEYYFPYAGQIGLWPSPAQTGNTIYVNQKTRVIDLSAADYTTGTVSAVTNGASTVTGSGTSWTAGMTGRYIRISYGDAANLGDGLWYEIAGVVSTTSLTLVRAYGGTTITAGSASYTIGQMPLLPEAYHDMPWLWAAGTYWQKEADERAASYFEAHGDVTPEPSGKVKELIDTWSSSTTDYVIDNGMEGDIVDPNLLITL